MAENNYLKQELTTRTAQISHRAYTAVDLDSMMYSYDRNVSKLIVPVISTSGAEFDFNDIKTVRVLLSFVHDGETKCIEDIAQIEDHDSKMLSYVVNDRLKGYSGTVTMNIYLDLKTNQEIDLAEYRFKMKKSKIDEKMPEIEELYFKTFDDVLLALEEKCEKDLADLKAQFEVEWKLFVEKKTTDYSKLQKLYEDLMKTAAALQADITAVQKKFDSLDIYSKQEVDELIFDTIIGDRTSVSGMCDFEGKITGSEKQNPHSFHRSQSSSLINPLESSLENTQLHYDNVSKLDGVVQAMSWTGTGTIAQNLFKWNVIADIEKRYPSLFVDIGAKNIEEKVTILRQLISKLSVSAFGYGGGAAGNGLNIKIWRGNAWGTETSFNGSGKVEEISLKWENEADIIPIILQDDGYVYVLIHAPTSNGVTSSHIRLDYACMNYELNVGMMDIYALKSNVYTKKESNDDLLDKFFGGSLVSEKIIDFRKKIAKSVVENPNISGNYLGAALWNPSAVYSELSQAAYDWIASSDETLFSPKTQADGFMSQQLFIFDITEQIDRDFPGLFACLKAESRTQKVIVARKIISLFTIKAHGYGSGASGNKFTLNILGSNGTWYGGQYHTASEIKTLNQAIGQSNNYFYMHNDGYLYALVSAPPSDGVTPSIVNMDYISIDYTLTTTATDIYALKSDVELKADKATTYTKTEVDTKLSSKADTAKAQMFKITADNGTNRFSVPSGTSLMDKINAEGYGYYLVGVSASALDVPQIAQGYQAVVQSNSTSNPTGTVLLKANNGRMFTRGFTNGTFVGTWLEMADKTLTQMTKITADDGRPIATMTSGTILSTVTESAGVRSYVTTSTVTDHPPTSAAFRFMAQMTSATYGNVIGISDNGEFFTRSVVNGIWKTDWQKMFTSLEAEEFSKRLTALEAKIK